MTADRKNPWTVLTSQDVYDNAWIRVTHRDVLTPSGNPGIYGTVHFKNWAIGVVPVDAEGCTYLVGQYRFPTDCYSWEIPEGGGTVGVDPLLSAQRELREETGLAAKHWLKLLDCDLSNSVTDERAVAYVAWDLTSGTASPDPTEQLEIRRVPLHAAFAMVASGEIRDALSVLTLQALALRWDDGRLLERTQGVTSSPASLRPGPGRPSY
jgi:8-oxo-dGTP pyrophosphatase MutT (NUDIX family)